jgi:hypothetical protein
VRDTRVQTSWKEANEHAFELSFGMVTMLAAYGSVLAALAYFNVPIAWMTAAGFLFSTVVVCNVVIEGIRHLDVGRCNLQQTCSALQEATEAKAASVRI